MGKSMEGKDWVWRLLLGEQSARMGGSEWGLFAAGFVPTTIGILLTLLVAITLRHLLHVSANLLLFFPVLVLAAVRYGFIAALWASLASVLVTSFALAEPRYSFAVADAETLWAMMAFILVAAIVSSLAARVREQMLAIEAKNALTESLYAFSARLSGVAEFEDLVEVFSTEAGRLLGATASLRRSGEVAMLVGHESDAQRECLRESKMIARSLQGETEEVCVPMLSEGSCRAVARIVRAPFSQPFSMEDRRLLEVIVNQCVIVLDRLDLADRLRNAKVQAEAERMRAALLTAVSHDLKTPLASILGNISGLRKYSDLYDEATRLDMLLAAETATERLGRFVENLLDMTRIDADAVVGKIEKVDLADVVGAAMKSAERLLVRHWVRVELPQDMPMVDADEVLLDHLLVNLLDNAAKYSPEGSLILISATLGSEEIGLHVSDEGPGIPEQDLQRIFDRFFRIPRQEESASGSGLGLAICKSFAEVMGIRITAANRSDVAGASFSVRFPLRGEAGK